MKAPKWKWQTAVDEAYHAEKGGAGSAIEYLDIEPKPFVTQISLVEYFERTKRFKADRWQKDFCERLQTAAENRHIKRTWQLFHAESQLGKTTIKSQCFPAWLYGHDPLFRFALAMYNAKQSEKHSKVIIQILQSPLHKSIFTNKDGWLFEDKGAQSGWMTNARRELNDGQYSLNPVGLISGLTGSGFDWLSMDDPYRNEKDAFSEAINNGMHDFYDYTVLSRAGLHSNISGMFHRYAPEDFAGYLLDTGDFDYVRYSTICDGDYIHDTTGKRYVDPTNRKIGEYISERRNAEHYEKARKNNRVWLSMFQGRPSSEEGDFFNVGKIQTLSAEETAKRRLECSIFVRAWDLAATEEGGDYSVGGLMGMSADGKVTIFDIIRKQVDTAGRDALQLKTAERDGADVVVTVPSDVGAGGKSTVFHIQQLLKNYTVIARSVSGSKEDRARNFAGAVNSGDVTFADDSHLPKEKQWIATAKKEMRNFPLSDHDDIVDESGDAYNECNERMIKGLLITNFLSQRNLVNQTNFERVFKTGLIPRDWKVYAGVKINADKSLPTSAILCARASENTGLKETLFVFAEYKAYDGDYERLFNWLTYSLKTFCEVSDKSNTTIWLHKDSAHFRPTIVQKLNVTCMVFDENVWAGITETNWYLTPRGGRNPFNPLQQSSGLYLRIANGQESRAENAFGLYSLRQEITTVGFNDKGEPQKTIALLDCLRMATFRFRTQAKELTIPELIDSRMPEILKQANQTEVLSAGRAMAIYEEESRIRKALDLPRENVKYDGDFFEKDTWENGGW